jgi:hypothetical protein
MIRIIFLLLYEVFLSFFVVFESQIRIPLFARRWNPVKEVEAGTEAEVGEAEEGGEQREKKKKKKKMDRKSSPLSKKKKR